MRNVWHYFVIILGIVAPTFELLTGFCAGVFFDPLPTTLHVIGFYLIPNSLLIVKALLSRPYTRTRGRIAGLSIVYSLTLTSAYAIWFLPISWISVLGVLFLGLGLFGLTPFFLFSVVIGLFRDWKEWVPEGELARYRRAAVLSPVVILPVLVFLWWNPIVIKVGESMLHSDSASTRYRGLSILRTFADKHELQRHCYDINNHILGVEVLDDEVLREAFYYIHGTRAGIARADEGFFGASSWEFDDAQGETEIGRRQEGLALKESALDAVVEAVDGYGYYEWTMVFENKSLRSREARAAVQLPPYSVVSKASLWIDGEECEAAFGGTSHVKSVYREIVKQRRDPLLVTMIGPEQVQVQCFPVLAESTMKIRLGVTCPLVDSNRLAVPFIIESNFTIDESLQHNVWLEADVPATRLVAGDDGYDTAVIRTLTQEELMAPTTYFAFAVDPVDSYEYAGGALRLSRADTAVSAADPILVIDGRDDVLGRLDEVDWSRHQFGAVIVAQPYGFEEWSGDGPLPEFLEDIDSYPGVNPSPALMAALRKGQATRGPVVWLHGSLPSGARQELAFEQITRRSADPVVITTVALSGGLNSLVSDLTTMRYFAPAPVTGEVDTDLRTATRIAATDHPSESDTIFLAGRPGSAQTFDKQGEIGQSHPYRLYLYSQIMQAWYDHGEVADELVSEALMTRLVTPVSGAIVLESQSQYDQAGLDPSVGAEHIPSVPEPEFYILLGLAALVGAGLYFQKRRAGCLLSH